MPPHTALGSQPGPSARLWPELVLLLASARPEAKCPAPLHCARSQGCIVPGPSMATVAMAQAQGFAAGWAVALWDVTVWGRSQDTAEGSSCRAEAVSAQHLPANEQLSSTCMRIALPLRKGSHTPGSGSDPTMPWGAPTLPLVHWGAQRSQQHFAQALALTAGSASGTLGGNLGEWLLDSHLDVPRALAWPSPAGLGEQGCVGNTEVSS